MSDPYETTEEHLERLLGRALNSFDLPDATVERLESALAHSTSLHSSHHSAGLHRETFKHVFLLSDGSSLTLWELAHNAGRDGTTQHELYTEAAEVRLAASRLPRPGGTDAFGPSCADVDGGDPDGGGAGLDADLEILATLMATRPPAARRVFVPDDSADHARRVLRRAENADRPGPDAALRLSDAVGHQITQAFGRQCSVEGRDAGFTLYEHAFLLADRTEVSLWEVEHTATPDGRHMCEVYETERAAREAMELRARVR
ncbi:hypothetical protein AR457_20355 [Streptomyces agglomeratus]|uniref:Uncharacterized protein n=1 Tax=Streptomyces agglomeratus TaxID=285458 RepID=A0A1E5PA73_9ACTN|nr:DUF6227 family protein [Streptomyces agglomeratus]OEJ26451.1 hypothetical protein AS594_20115 [Streptomyces agglomeratus]OEJ39483.1 hypothetical protein BGK70_16295 [Streptomyces agglomeratus]OEJ46133.1 hypothetical protein AR457_20355 [Streptomyces agglomeratus]OEJ52038.1 hypothetical protein BGK72_15920 [Streptomyces agglomeratus]OEJ59405.1 hypothetical protein BGM19_16835 [Streptomyces agglomeratus]